MGCGVHRGSRQWQDALEAGQCLPCHVVMKPSVISKGACFALRSSNAVLSLTAARLGGLIGRGIGYISSLSAAWTIA